MNGKRQKTSTQQQQLLLAFAEESRRESPMAFEEGTVLVAADLSTESPTSKDRLMERICDPLNLECAMARVIANGGAPGRDGMTVKELEKYFERHSGRIIDELLSGTYAAVTSVGTSSITWHSKVQVVVGRHREASLVGRQESCTTARLARFVQGAALHR